MPQLPPSRGFLALEEYFNKEVFPDELDKEILGELE